MRSKLTTLLAVLGAVTLLVLAGNTVALATTGKALIGGKTTSVAKATGITRTTPGNVLVLKSKKSTDAPLAVNGTGKVANLNADTVDGKDSGVLGTRALVWTWSGQAASNVASRTWTLKDVPAGTYQFGYEVSLGILSAPAGDTLSCQLSRLSQFIGGRTVETNDPNEGVAVTGTAVMTLPAKADIALTCRMSKPSDNSDVAVSWAVGTNNPVRITAIPITGLTSKGSPVVS